MIAAVKKTEDGKIKSQTFPSTRIFVDDDGRGDDRRLYCIIGEHCRILLAETKTNWTPEQSTNEWVTAQVQELLVKREMEGHFHITFMWDEE